MRKLRHIPKNSLVEITSRTFQGRHLLRPTRRLRTLTLGILARGAKRYAVKLHAFVFLSNHFHMLLTVRDEKALAPFLQYLKSNLAREVGRLYNWEGTVFGERYDSAIVSQEPAAQLARLRYLLSQGVKEGLVASAAEWPGAHGTQALLSPLGQNDPVGIWVDRTGLCKAREKDPAIPEAAFESRETVPIEPLPCLASRTDQERIEVVRRLLDSIDAEYVEPRRNSGRRFPTTSKLRRGNPHYRPRRLRKRRAPWFHAATGAVRKRMLRDYREIVCAYREAAEELRLGGTAVVFPEGCFPPRITLPPGGGIRVSP